MTRRQCSRFAFRESACSDAHVAIETRRDEKEREFVKAREESIADVKDREKGEIEARSYFRVTVALPSVSRHRLCATRCILPLSSDACVCVCTMHRAYLYLAGGRSGLVLACSFLYACMCMLHACTHAYTRLCMCREGQWFRRFYYSALRAELTQVSVW